MKRIVFIICGIAGLAAIIAIIFFVSKFGFGPASTISNWGAVGDFFGGVLNPTFALLSLILIAYTLGAVDLCSTYINQPTLVATS